MSLTSKVAQMSFFFFNFIFKLYITVLVLPNIKMNFENLIFLNLNELRVWGLL